MHATLNFSLSSFDESISKRATSEYPATLFTCAGVLWRTKYTTIVAILIQWDANKWPGIIFLPKDAPNESKIQNILVSVLEVPLLCTKAFTPGDGCVCDDLSNSSRAIENGAVSVISDALSHAQCRFLFRFGRHSDAANFHFSAAHSWLVIKVCLLTSLNTADCWQCR